MAEKVKIKFWQGLEASRSGITPDAGVPIWVTDTKLLYVGDGSTAGGIAVGSGGGGAGFTVGAGFPGSPTEGDGRFNTTTDKAYLYVGDAWVDVTASGGTAFTVGAGFPASPTEGDGRFNTTTERAYIYVGDAWIDVTSTGGSGSTIGHENDSSSSGDYTITSTRNMVTAGPFTVEAGDTITVPAGSTWTIV